MKYSLRLLALASTTVCGVFFLGNVINLLFAYNYTHHRFAPALAKTGDFTETILLGAGFLCSVIPLYRMAVRNMGPVPTLKRQHNLNVFATKLRWTVVFVGTIEFFFALRFFGKGLFGMYFAYLGGLTAVIFVFFPDASYYLGKWMLGFKTNSAKFL
jgi:hypothetical protein